MLKEMVLLAALGVGFTKYQVHDVYATKKFKTPSQLGVISAASTEY